jgi:hypothetical protein
VAKVESVIFARNILLLPSTWGLLGWESEWGKDKGNASRSSFFAVRRGRPGLANQCNGRASQFPWFVELHFGYCQISSSPSISERSTARGPRSGKSHSRRSYSRLPRHLPPSPGGRRGRRRRLLHHHRVVAPRLGHCR